MLDHGCNVIQIVNQRSGMKAEAALKYGTQSYLLHFGMMGGNH